MNRKSAEHLVHVTVSVADRKEIEVNFLEGPAVNEAFQVSENEPVFALPGFHTQKQTYYILLITKSNWNIIQ